MWVKVHPSFQILPYFMKKLHPFPSLHSPSLVLLFTILLVIPFHSSCYKSTPLEGPVTPEWVKENYEKREVMIPVRDCVKLSTTIYEPRDGKKHPIILSRTPYGLSPYGDSLYSRILHTYMREFTRNRYIIVLQSVRGTFLSEGEYENIRPVSMDGTPDEVTDTYDTIEWLLHNTRSTGKVGVKGVSYPGFYSTLASLCGHPALRAVSPQAPVTDWWKGDDVHHNGVFMLSDMYSFGASFFLHRDSLTTRWRRPVVSVPEDGDIYDWYLEKGDFPTLSSLLGDSLRFWNEAMAHPDYDGFWKRRSPLQHIRESNLGRRQPAILVVGGEFDAEDCWGALETFKTYASQPYNRKVHFILGPWPHGGWREVGYPDRVESYSLGESHFGDGGVEYFVSEVEYPFFRYYLEGRGRRPHRVEILPSVGVDSTDSSYSPVALRKYYDCWPPEGTTEVNYYLREDGGLSTEAPIGDMSCDRYISDISAPVPYMDTKGPNRDRNYMASDQRFADEREDVLSYRSATLSDTLKVEGPVSVHLESAISSTDADFIVKLIDVRPDGYEMLVRMECMRGRYRLDLSSPSPMTPGEIATIEYDMPDVAHYFLPGHSLMVQVQSTCFPLMAVNPQFFQENPYTVRKEEYRDCEVSIYHDSIHRSYVTLRVASSGKKQ